MNKKTKPKQKFVDREGYEETILSLLSLIENLAEQIDNLYKMNVKNRFSITLLEGKDGSK